VLRSWSHRIRLGNGAGESFDPFRHMDLPEDVRAHILADYGSRALEIVETLETHPEWRRRMVAGLPHILAEAHFAVIREKARTLEDVLARRTRITLLDPERGRGCLQDVCEIMANGLNWGPGEIRRQIESYEKAVREKFPGPKDL
jgi:glycerol-3-phosphate dehydrogenase